MSKLGKRLIRAAKEARNIAQGKAKASSYRIHLRGDIDVIENDPKAVERALAAA